MIKLSDRSIVELIALEEKWSNAWLEEVPGALGRLIDVQEVIYEQLRDNPDEEQGASVHVFQRKLVMNLVRYGAYLKTENCKDYHVEESSLKFATTYDPSNQAAFYRLGVLAYKAKQFAKAVGYFQNALEPIHVSEGYRFKLTPQQEYNALLYLGNSALSTAENSQVSLGKVMGDINRSQLEYADFSEWSKWINAGDEYLANHEYVILSTNGNRYCSGMEYQEIINAVNLNTLILDFTGRNIELRFEGKVTGVPLSIIEAELLEDLMLHSSEKHPLRGGQLREPMFSSPYRQKITGLRNLIGKLELDTPAIKNKTIRIGAGRTAAYYYNQTLSFKVIYQESELY